jgi:hypothetical protein
LHVWSSTRQCINALYSNERGFGQRDGSQSAVPVPSCRYLLARERVNFDIHETGRFNQQMNDNHSIEIRLICSIRKRGLSEDWERVG